MRRVVLFGDSHAHAFVEASRIWHFFEGDQADEPFVSHMIDCGLIYHEIVIEQADGKTRLNPLFEIALDRMYLLDRFSWTYKSDNDIGLMLGFADVHLLGFISELFSDFGDLLTADNIANGSGFVYFEMLVEMFRGRLAKVEKAVIFLQEKGFGVFLVAGPPPSSDVAISNARGSDFTPASSAVRRAIFLAIKRALTEIAQRRGIKFVGDHSGFETDDGMLDEQYVDDGVHANAIYARDFVPVILRELGRTVAPYKRGANDG